MSHSSFDEKEILKGHFRATFSRFFSCKEKVLILQDTTQFTFTRNADKLIGKTHKIGTAKLADGRAKTRMVRGILMHSSLAV